MTAPRDTLEFTVAELDCAAEARQIEGGPRAARWRAIVTYDPDRTGPDAIRGAVRALGMTVLVPRAEVARRRRSLPDQLGWAFVSVARRPRRPRDCACLDESRDHRGAADRRVGVPCRKKAGAEEPHRLPVKKMWYGPDSMPIHSRRA